MYAVKNARPISASSQTRDLLVRVLAEREPDLHDHVLDVGALAREVAAELGIPEQEHAEIVHGAELHDVGKIAIPESILHKPGPLDDDEWVYMKRHTLIGERFLLAAPGAARRRPRSSAPRHERWDGGGYPDGLPARTSRSAPASSRSATPTTRWSPTARTGAAPTRSRR